VKSVIPAEREVREPESMNAEPGIWIPGSPLRGDPE